MKRLAVCILGIFAFGSGQAMEAPQSGEGKPAVAEDTPMPLRAALTDDVIERTVRASLADLPAPEPTSASAGRAFGADPYRDFRRQFSQAQKSSCLHPDALKHQPARIGPIQLGGLLALPHWAAAIARGKCR